MENEYNNWARFHKKEIIEKIIAEAGAAPQSHPMAIVMAGLPGAGKTEISKHLIRLSGINFVRLDMDELAALICGYKPQKADQFRLAATTLLNELLLLSIRRSLDIVIDGTFSSQYAIRNVERLSRHGYIVKIILVSQVPKIAWDFTKAREKMEHRAIKLEGFIRAYYSTIENIKRLKLNDLSTISIDLVHKYPNNSIGQWLNNIDPAGIDEYIEIEYNIDKLKNLLKDSNDPKKTN